MSVESIRTVNLFPRPYAVPFAFPGLPGVRCLFATMAAGDMSEGNGGERRAAAEKNRKNFMTAAGFSRWAEIRQVHGDALIPAKPLPNGRTVGEAPSADGHYTGEPGVGLAIRTADCQPLLLARSDGGAVAALHVGWRGNAADFPGTAVARLCRALSCSPGDLLAVRGPSLGPAASEFVNFAAEWPPKFRPWLDAVTQTVNLWELTRRQLEDAGLRRDRIFSLDLCTRDSPKMFFSHRRGDAGRQVSAVWIRSDAGTEYPGLP